MEVGADVALVLSLRGVALRKAAELRERPEMEVTELTRYFAAVVATFCSVSPPPATAPE
jgi:hypothetical protein